MEQPEKRRTVSQLYVSVIMTPTLYPDCFCGSGPIQRTLLRHGFDPSSIANGLGRFLAVDENGVDFLYIVGTPQSIAESFYMDLKRCLQQENEITFHTGLNTVATAPTWKHVILLLTENGSYGVPSEAYEHVILEFGHNYDAPRFYLPFERGHLAAFVYCGNSNDGPIDKFRCRNPDGVMCVRRRFKGARTCGICFVIGCKHRMRAPWVSGRFDYDTYDEGVVSDALGTPNAVFTDMFSDTDVSSIGESDEISDEDW